VLPFKRTDTNRCFLFTGPLKGKGYRLRCKPIPTSVVEFGIDLTFCQLQSLLQDVKESHLLHGTCMSASGILTTLRVGSSSTFSSLSPALDGYIHLWVGTSPPSSPTKIIARGGSTTLSLPEFAQGLALPNL
jgi:hypothetical protein